LAALYLAALLPARASAQGAAVPDIFSANSKTPCIYAATSIPLMRSFSQLTGKRYDCVLVDNNAKPTWQWWEQLWVDHPPHPGMDVIGWVHSVPGRRLIISQPMVPDDVPSNWRQLGAEGKYDGYAKQFAKNLVSLGLGSSVIRLGWEANANDSPETAVGNNLGQWQAWARYWANIVRSMRSVAGADFIFDWTVNEYKFPIPLADWYPGNDVVDVVGIDAYDAGIEGSALTPRERWRQLASQPDGLDAVAAFAAAHKKPLSLPEWGLVARGPGQGAGDDPTYVAGLAHWIATHDVMYEAYFYEPGDAGLVFLPQAPASLRIYEHDFPNGPKLPRP
jgi:hypothetical protein